MSAKYDDCSGGMLDAEAMAGVNQMVNEVRENPALFLEPQYAPLRELAKMVRDNPEQFPLSSPTNDSQVGDEEDDEEKEDADKKVAAAPRGSDDKEQQPPSSTSTQDDQTFECVCSELFLVHLESTNNSGHADYCLVANQMLRVIQILKLYPEQKTIIGNLATPVVNSLSKLAEHCYSHGLEHGSITLKNASIRYRVMEIGESDEINETAKEKLALLLAFAHRWTDLENFLHFEIGNPNSTLQYDSVNSNLTQQQRDLACEGLLPFGSKKRPLLDEDDSDKLFQKEYWNRLRGHSTLPYMLAFLLSQVDQLAQTESARQDWASGLDIFFESTHRGQQLEFLRNDARTMVCGAHDYVDPREKKITTILMTMIDEWNPTILPALVHPDPLREGCAGMGFGFLYFPGTAIEAWEYAQMLQPELSEKAMEMLVERYGEQPTYPMYFP